MWDGVHAVLFRSRRIWRWCRYDYVMLHEGAALVVFDDLHYRNARESVRGGVEDRQAQVLQLPRL